MKVLTDRYPATIKPVRDGWYLTCAFNPEWYDAEWSLTLWTRGMWSWSNGEPTHTQARFWRGLTFNPVTATHWANTVTFDAYLVKIAK